MRVSRVLVVAEGLPSAAPAGAFSARLAVKGKTGAPLVGCETPPGLSVP